MEPEQPQTQFRYLDEFKIIKTLGNGYHSDVKLGVKDGKEYAIKKYKPTANINTLKTQVENIQKLDHPNIMKLYDFREVATYKRINGQQYQCIAIILEYDGGNQLFNYVIMTQFNQKLARTYFVELLDALQHMHSRNVVHRDIKLGNLIINQKFSLKVIDFGFSKYIQDNQQLHQKLGTPGYKAPEIFSQNYNGKVTDLFAAAVTLFSIVIKAKPFSQATTTNNLYKMFIQKRFDQYWDNLQQNFPHLNLSAQFKNLIENMFAFNPSQRLTLEQVRNHQWTKGQTFTANQLSEELNITRQQILQQIQAKRQNQLQQHQHMLNPPSSDMRSTSQFSTFYQTLDSIQLDQSKLKQTDPNPNDIILDVKPSFFCALVHRFLKAERDNNIIALRTQKQYFQISFDTTKNQINVLLDYSVDLEDQQLTIVIQLFKANNGLLRVRCLRNQGDDIQSYRLIKLIKDEFAYLAPK